MFQFWELFLRVCVVWFAQQPRIELKVHLHLGKPIYWQTEAQFYSRQSQYNHLWLPAFKQNRINKRRSGLAKPHCHCLCIASIQHGSHDKRNGTLCLPGHSPPISPLLHSICVIKRKIVTEGSSRPNGMQPGIVFGSIIGWPISGNIAYFWQFLCNLDKMANPRSWTRKREFLAFLVQDWICSQFLLVIYIAELPALGFETTSTSQHVTRQLGLPYGLLPVSNATHEAQLIFPPPQHVIIDSPPRR